MYIFDPWCDPTQLKEMGEKMHKNIEANLLAWLLLQLHHISAIIGMMSDMPFPVPSLSSLSVEGSTWARIFKLLMSPRIDSKDSLAGWYGNTIPNRFLAPIDCLKFQHWPVFDATWISMSIDYSNVASFKDMHSSIESHALLTLQ
jgi:hypothetical protein